MRRLFVLSLSALLALSLATDAEANRKKKNKKDKSADTEQVADGDEAEEEDEGIVIRETGLTDVDAVFGKARTPVDTLTQTRQGLDRMNHDLNAALGLQEGTPLADAMEDLIAKAEGKLTVAMDDRSLPKVSAEEGVPENVQSAVSSLNSGLDELNAIAPQLGELPTQFAGIAEEGQRFTEMATLRKLAKNPIQAGKALPAIQKNVKALGMAKDEAADLVKSIDTLRSSLTSIGS